MTQTEFSAKHAVAGALLGLLCLLLAFPAAGMVRAVKPEDVEAFAAAFAARRLPAELPLITGLLGGLIGGVMLIYAAVTWLGPGDPDEPRR